jgi:hypothetical protein
MYISVSLFCLMLFLQILQMASDFSTILVALLGGFLHALPCIQKRPRNSKRKNPMTCLYDLPREVRLKIFEFYFQDLKVKIPDGLTLFQDLCLVETRQHEAAVLLASRKMYRESFYIFLATTRFRIVSQWLSSGCTHFNEHKSRIRHISFDGKEVRANINKLRAHFPKLLSLDVYYQPKTAVNFASLRDFAACKNFCCDRGFKELLLNALFWRESRIEECWISAFAGQANKFALLSHGVFEVKIFMNLRQLLAVDDNSSLVRFTMRKGASSLSLHTQQQLTIFMSYRTPSLVRKTSFSDSNIRTEWS